MRALATSLVLAACGPSSPRPAPPPEPVANTVPDAGAAASPSETGEGSEVDRWVAEGEASREGGTGAAASEGSAKALVLFQQACDQDHPRGCEMLAETLIDGAYYGVPEDHRTAAIAYDRACRLAQAHACYRYGFYVLEGIIDYRVEDGALVQVRYGADDHIARALVHKGCDLGAADACQRIQDDPRLQ